MEKTNLKPMSLLEREARKRVYEQLAGVSEKDLNAFWESLKERSPNLSEEDIQLNEIVEKVKTEFEIDRKQQIQRFRLISFLKFHEWIEAYNAGPSFKEMNDLGERLASYLFKSTEPMSFPLPKENNERFSGFVAFEAIKMYAKFQHLRSWIKASGAVNRKIAEIRSFEELMSLNEDTFWKPSFTSVITRIDQRSAAD